MKQTKCTVMKTSWSGLGIELRTLYVLDVQLGSFRAQIAAQPRNFELLLFMLYFTGWFDAQAIYGYSFGVF